jgi:peptidoglycan/LPS O-acetylase OafA/YrhL
VFRCLAEFLLGLLAFRVADQPAGRAMARSCWAVPALCGAVLVCLMVLRTDVFLAGLLFPLLLVGLSAETNAIARLLSTRVAMWLGGLSYGMYLTHELLSPAVIWIHAQAAARGVPHAQTLGAAFGVTFTFVTATAAYHWIELPGRRWLRHVFEGKSVARVNAELTDHGSPVSP